MQQSERWYVNVPKAYQLHYLFQLQTWRNRPLLATEEAKQRALRAAREVCAFNGYSLLAAKPGPLELEILVSLLPEHVPAEAVTRLKTNISRLFFQYAPGVPPSERHLWGSGKRVLTTGKVDLGTTIEYIARQYEKDYPHNLERVRPEAFVHPRSRALMSDLSEGHACHCLMYHVVFASEGHAAVMDEPGRLVLRRLLADLGEELRRPIIRAESLYNHVHFLVRAKPEDAPGVLAEEFLNALTDRAVERGVTGTRRLFREGLYVGSVGECSTAVVKSWLQSPSASAGGCDAPGLTAGPLAVGGVLG